MICKVLTSAVLAMSALVVSCEAADKGEKTLSGRYDSYKGLVMAGYQGWFNAPEDEAGRGWYHYRGANAEFLPGNCTIDFWPDVSEYEKTYRTSFVLSDGSPASVFSSNDASTVATHFRWMKEYGIDGVFMQRFVGEIANNSGKRHFNKVLQSAIDASTEYDRAICIMYDLSGMPTNGVDVLLNDARTIMEKYGLKERQKAPDYLFHNDRPLIVVWGVGFNDNRWYGLDEADAIIDGLKTLGYSIMLGVPTYWRTLGNDTIKEKRLHETIRKCDIIMPWFVGRYDNDSYRHFKELIVSDMAWCKREKVDYAPLCFPGFSWRNMDPDSRPIDRKGGEFIWHQLSYCLDVGAEMLYIAMFDEIDEGTAIFKCANCKNVPDNGVINFQGIDDNLPTDHYLWLVGQAARMLHGQTPLSNAMPQRND